MPVFSRTENLLICRYNNYGEVDPNSARILSKWATSKESFNIALPFFSIELQIQQKKVLEENIFFRTVSMLKNIKSKEGMNDQQVIDYIVEKTALDRLVVKTILKRVEKNTDHYTGATYIESSSQVCYLLYDPIGKKYLFPCLHEDQYNRFRAVEIDSVRPNTKRHDLSFVLQMGNHPERALLLGFDHNENSWEQYNDLTTAPPVPKRVLEEIKRNIEAKDDGKHVEVKEIGNWEPVFLVCNCCIDKDDLSSIAVHSVVSDKYSRYLLDIIKSVATSNPLANQELLSELKRIEEIRRFQLENASLFLDEQKDAQVWLLARYPDLKQFEDVRKKVSTFIARFPKDFLDNKDRTILQSAQWTDSQREDITSDFHTAMETIFETAVNRCYPDGDDQRIKDAFIVLKPRRKNYTDYFVPMAQEIGFTDIKLCENFFATSTIRANDIKKILANADPRSQSNDKKKYGLSELILAMMIEANADETHPFRNIAPKCPNLFEAMKSSKVRRDRIIHKDEEKLPISSVDELFRMRALVELCLELIAPRSGTEQVIQTETALNGQYAARVKADEEVKQLKSLLSLEGTREAVWNVSYRFYYKDPLYFSECYNLMDGLLLELINRYDCPNGETLIEETFTVSADSGAWEKVQKLFEKYHCSYLKDLPPPATGDLLRDKRQIKKWSMRNKLAVLFVTFDKDQPDVLNNIIKDFPDIVLVTDEIHKARGHNNSTDFSASSDGYTTFTNHLLACCEETAKMILEVK